MGHTCFICLLEQILETLQIGITDMGGLDLAVLHGDKGRDAHNAEFAGKGGLGVHVDLAEIALMKSLVYIKSPSSSLLSAH